MHRFAFHMWSVQIVYNLHSKYIFPQHGAKNGKEWVRVFCCCCCCCCIHGAEYSIVNDCIHKPQLIHHNYCYTQCLHSIQIRHSQQYRILNTYCITLGIWDILTINEPIDYMARAVMILMRGKDIMRAIGRGRPWK